MASKFGGVPVDESQSKFGGVPVADDVPGMEKLGGQPPPVPFRASGNGLPAPKPLQGPAPSVGQRALQNLPLSLAFAPEKLVANTPGVPTDAGPLTGGEPRRTTFAQKLAMKPDFSDRSPTTAPLSMPSISPHALVESFANDPAGTVVNGAGALSGAVRGGSKLVDLLPDAERAGNNFKTVMGAAGDSPVDVSQAGTPALRAHELRSAGATMPGVINKFLQRTTEPGSGPLTFRESRDFASNAGRLSADENSRLIPPMKAQVSGLSKALSDANQSTAEKAGVGPLYNDAMTEYRRAMQLKSLGQKGAGVLGKAAAGAGAGYGAYEIGKRLRDGLK